MANSPKSFMSFQSLLNCTGSKRILWDVYKDNESVYRFSTIFMKILRCYIKRLIDSHLRGKFHSWDNLEENIIFQRNNFSDIKFVIKPKSSDGDAVELAKSDFKALAELIHRVREAHGWKHFPMEIQEFCALLNDPKENENLILEHCALWKSKKRIRYVASAYQAFKKQLFPDVDFLLEENYMLLYIKEKFWVVFQKDQVLTQCCQVMKPRGLIVNGKQEPFENTFADLLGAMHKSYKHCASNIENNFYCQSDLEWKFFCCFPFFTVVLFQKWKGVELYSKIS